MAILLIGSTGNGKSALGNFLINPNDEHILDRQTFQVAQDNKPQTQCVRSAARPINIKGHGVVPLTIIDTPGLNKSAAQDLGHMIETIHELKSIKEVKACIIVVKFNSKIDAQYKATMEYYSKILPSLFAKNVVIVMTDFATDERSNQLRRKQGIVVEHIKESTAKEIVDCTGLIYTPLVFTIDCLPFGRAEKQDSLNVREALLQYIHCQEPIEVDNLRVAKTAHLKRKDNEEIRKHEGAITGYNRKLQETDSVAKEALDELQSKEDQITETTKTVEHLQSLIDVKDSSESVILDTWSVNEEWKVMKRHVRNFDLRTKVKIESVTKWSNGKCEWKDYAKEDFRVRGTLEGDFMRGLYATLILKTSKRNIFADQLNELQEKLAAEMKTKNALEKERDDILQKYKQHTGQLKLLKDYIFSRRKTIKGLSSEYLSIKQAEEKLKELKKQ